jgi:hypothetical protein
MPTVEVPPPQQPHHNDHRHYNHDQHDDHRHARLQRAYRVLCVLALSPVSTLPLSLQELLRLANLTLLRLKLRLQRVRLLLFALEARPFRLHHDGRCTRGQAGSTQRVTPTPHGGSRHAAVNVRAV